MAGSEEADAGAIAPRVATQRDVARLAGVDRATVSRALDPDRRHLLTDDTVRRVVEAADHLRYRPNTLARGLRRQRSSIVSLSIPRALRDRSSEFIEGVEDRLRREGVALVVSFDEDARLLRASTGLLDGSIVITAGERPADRASYAQPAITVGFDRGAESDVQVDEPRGVAIAVEHLHRVGHRRVALLTEPESTPIGLRHRRAFVEAVERLGMSSTIVTFLPRRPASAPEACQALLQRPDRPTALVVTDDGAATGCYGAARTLGFRVPDDVSIMGYGDSGAAPFLLPPLTTIAVPSRTAGRRAAQMLLDRIEDRPADPVLLTPHLVQRGSTAPPA